MYKDDSPEVPVVPGTRPGSVPLVVTAAAVAPSVISRPSVNWAKAARAVTIANSIKSFQLQPASTVKYLDKPSIPHIR